VLFWQTVTRTLERSQSRQRAQKANYETGETSPGGQSCAADRSTDASAQDQ
jgi:hypothetical protein